MQFNYASNLTEQAYFCYWQSSPEQEESLKLKLTNPRFLSEIVRRMPCSKRAQLASKILSDIEEDFTLKPIPME